MTGELVVPEHGFPESGRLPIFQQERAALLIADAKYTDQQVAELVGVSRASIARWKTSEPFKMRVSVLRHQILNSSYATSKMDRAARLENLELMFGRLMMIVKERAADRSMQGVPGARSGLLHRRYKSVQTANGPDLMVEYDTDAALLREYRALLQHIAQERGEWNEKRDAAAEKSVDFTISFDRVNQEQV